MRKMKNQKKLRELYVNIDEICKDIWEIINNRDCVCIVVGNKNKARYLLEDKYRFVKYDGSDNWKNGYYYRPDEDIFFPCHILYTVGHYLTSNHNLPICAGISIIVSKRRYILSDNVVVTLDE